MKIFILAVGLFFVTGIVYAAEDAVLKDQRDKVSYGIGMDIGKSLKNQSIDVNADMLARGIKDMLSGAEPLMTDQEFRDTMMTFQKEMMAKQMEHAKEIGEKNKKEEEAFLAENKKKEGIISLPSGLQYKVITEGEGDIPKLTDTVTTHYRGTTVSGTEFDSSYRRGQPATFKVNGVIPGWTEALPLMKVGSKWQLFIPSHLAYGERGAGRDIGPNQMLIFEVELLSIQKEEESKEETDKEDIEP